MPPATGSNSDFAGGFAPAIHDIGGGSSSATLVLIDGHRFPTQGLTEAQADPTAIPASALQRVEVLPDGASSIYGSDAVAGVLNFITRKNFNGVELDTSNPASPITTIPSTSAACSASRGPAVRCWSPSTFPTSPTCTSASARFNTDASGYPPRPIPPIRTHSPAPTPPRRRPDRHHRWRQHGHSGGYRDAGCRPRHHRAGRHCDSRFVRWRELPELQLPGGDHFADSAPTPPITTSRAAAMAARPIIRRRPTSPARASATPTALTTLLPSQTRNSGLISVRQELSDNLVVRPGSGLRLAPHLRPHLARHHRQCHGVRTECGRGRGSNATTIAAAAAGEVNPFYVGQRRHRHWRRNSSAVRFQRLARTGRLYQDGRRPTPSPPPA